MARSHGVGSLLFGDQLAHPVERDAGLLATREHAANHARQEAQPSEIGREQRERAEIERPGRDRSGAHEQHETQADVGRTLAERHHALFEDTVAHGRVATAFDEHAEAAQHRLGRVVDLDGRGRCHHVAEQPGDVLGRLTVGAAILLDPRVEHPGRDADAEQRDDQHGRSVGRRRRRARTRRSR
jgi:hypothetical protein